MKFIFDQLRKHSLIGTRECMGITSTCLSLCGTVLLCCSVMAGTVQTDSPLRSLECTATLRYWVSATLMEHRLQCSWETPKKITWSLAQEEVKFSKDEDSGLRRLAYGVTIADHNASIQYLRSDYHQNAALKHTSAPSVFAQCDVPEYSARFLNDLTASYLLWQQLSPTFEACSRAPGKIQVPLSTDLHYRGRVIHDVVVQSDLKRVTADLRGPAGVSMGSIVLADLLPTVRGTKLPQSIDIRWAEVAIPAQTTWGAGPSTDRLRKETWQGTIPSPRLHISLRLRVLPEAHLLVLDSARLYGGNSRRPLIELVFQDYKIGKPTPLATAPPKSQ